METTLLGVIEVRAPRARVQPSTASTRAPLTLHFEQRVHGGVLHNVSSSPPLHAEAGPNIMPRILRLVTSLPAPFVIGPVQINPRQILNDGVRKHLVRQIAIALHENLIFDVKASGRKDPKVRA